jgi:hypothetical protein
MSMGVGLVLAMLALAMQLAAGSLMMPRLASDDFSTALTASICHAGTDDNAPAPHRAPDCALCPICQAMAQAHPLLAPPEVAVVAPMAFVVLAITRKSSHARPNQAATPATARGPPATT